MFIIFLVVFISYNIAIAAVLPGEKDSIILNYNYENYGRGNYMFSYVTSNGIRRSESGQLVNPGQDNEHIAVQGYFSYTDPDGSFRLVKYIADKNGYRVMESSVEDVKPNQMVVQAVSSQVLASLLG